MGHVGWTRDIPLGYLKELAEYWRTQMRLTDKEGALKRLWGGTAIRSAEKILSPERVAVYPVPPA